MRRIAVAVVIAVGISACAHVSYVATTSVASSRYKGGPDTFVTLVQQKDGTCVATGGVGDLGAKKSGKITWHVSNGCTTDQYLVFTHYQQHLDPLDPTKLGPVVTDVVNPDPDYSNKIRAGAKDKTVDGFLIKDNNTTDDIRYKYWICVGPSPKPGLTNCLDPDVDVWPSS